jgi:hypothetical protein
MMAYAQNASTYPQFKKVFRYFDLEIHTACAERFLP